MTVNKKWLMVLTLAGILGACAPIYIPPAAHIPQLEHKGEMQFGLFYGMNGLDMQGSYAAGDHQAFMATISMGSNSDSAGTNKTAHFYGEGAYGVFSANGVGRFSAFAGMGAGTGQGQSTWSYNSTSYTEQAAGTYLRPFLQGNIGLNTGFFDLGLATRLAWVWMTYTSGNQNIPPNANALMLEPVLYMGLGGNKFKVFGQGGFSAPLNKNMNFGYNPIIISLGINFHIH